MTQIPLPPMVSLRPGWLICQAALGPETILLGACRDVNALDGEIDFGLLAPAAVQKIEADLQAPIDKLIADGTTLEIHFDLRGQQLIDLKPLTDPGPRSLSRMPPIWHSGGIPGRAPMRSVNDYTPFADEIVERAEAFHVDFARRRECALQLRRPRWDIAKARHREDFGWLPPMAIEWLRRKSRDFLLLPPPPLPAIGELAIPIRPTEPPAERERGSWIGCVKHFLNSQPQTKTAHDHHHTQTESPARSGGRNL